MLDIKFIRENLNVIKKKLSSRNEKYSDLIDNLINIDLKRRESIKEIENLKSILNNKSKEIITLKNDNKLNEMNILLEKLKELKSDIESKQKNLDDTESLFQNAMLSIPNIPLDDVPIGKTDKDNKVIKLVGEPKNFDFDILDHVDLGKKLDILDFEIGAKIAGKRFAFMKGLGAKLERAIFTFMLDTHTEKGYREVLTPFMANKESFYGTGQLPKFEEDLFKCQDNFYLIPTAEVPITNIHRKEILDEKDLPIKYVGFSPCFRRESGSYGKDTRGLIRNHQFDKVELVKFVKPCDGEEELLKLLDDACSILDLLELPYRIVKLCTGDIGFSSAKTYDIEVWMPFAKEYREISSCSLFTDFQARRLSIKYKSQDKKENSFVYTINGSGLAVGRTFAAILENYQENDGSIVIPKVLRKYMNNLEKISK